MKQFFLCVTLLLSIVSVYADNFSDKFLNKKWILEYYNEIIYYEDRNLLLNYIPKYKNQKDLLFQRKTLLDECDYWYDTISDTSIIYLLFEAFEINDINQINNNYYKISLQSGFIDSEKYNNNLENGCDWKNKDIKIENLYYKFDGDYLYIYLNDSSNLLTTYCAYEESEYTTLIKILQTNENLYNTISLPRHADGTCDYNINNIKNTSIQKHHTFTSTTKTNVSLYKTMFVKENLKLRSGEATSTQVLAVMQAGTNVKILELGKVETIDGINSNWVKVEVQAGAKDRDGKPIKAGTVGWCYGGYLK